MYVDENWNTGLQFFGFCRQCQRQVLFTHKKHTVGWWACNPYMKRFHFAGENGVPFILPDGSRHMGIIGRIDGGGVLGYLPHSCEGDK